MTKRNKSLSYLIEAELEKATVLIAAKSITDKLQQIAETLAKMDANDVMPLGDSMRDLFGADEASSFEQAVSEKLRALTEQVRDTKNQIADQIDALESGQPMNDLGNMDDKDMFGDSDGDGDAEMGGDDMGGDEGISNDDDAGDLGMGGEADEDMGDDLASAFSGGGGMGAAGRPRKESFEPTGRKQKLDELSKNKLSAYDKKAENSYADAARGPGSGGGETMGKRLKGRVMARKKMGTGPNLDGKTVKVNATESADYRLTREFSALIRKGNSTADSVKMIAESYALPVKAVVGIISAIRESKLAEADIAEGLLDTRVPKDFANMIRAGKTAGEAGKELAKKYAIPLDKIVEVIKRYSASNPKHA